MAALRELHRAAAEIARLAESHDLIERSELRNIGADPDTRPRAVSYPTPYVLVLREYADGTVTLTTEHRGDARQEEDL